MNLEPADTSGAKTADGVIYARPCVLLGVDLVTGTTNVATAILYDNAASAAGTVLAQMAMVAGASSYSQSAELPANGVVCANGIFLDIGGSGATAIVYYRPL